MYCAMTTEATQGPLIIHIADEAYYVYRPLIYTCLLLYASPLLEEASTFFLQCTVLAMRADEQALKHCTGSQSQHLDSGASSSWTQL